MRLCEAQELHGAPGSEDRPTPLLSIACVTYNHAPYIAQAIEGFLAQRVGFPVEILIHDDASSDGTAEQVRAYQERYPQLIRAILQTENQHSQGVEVMANVRALCRGKYIAFCEGDDYWVDPDKLQTQVSFLEANPDYVMSGHDCSVISADGKILKRHTLNAADKRDATSFELMALEVSAPSRSRVYRNVPIVFPPEKRRVMNGDVFLQSMLGRYGKYKYHDDILPACYRLHEGGIWSSLSQYNQLYEMQNARYWLYRYHVRNGEEKVANALLRKHRRLLLRMLLCAVPGGDFAWRAYFRIYRRLGTLYRRTA